MKRGRLPPKVVREAIKCGPVPKLRHIDDICADPRTQGEEVIAFAALHLVIPTGMMRGQPLILDPFQQAFILAIFDNPASTRTAIFSIAARNGKTFLISVILLAYLIGPLAERNINIASGASSREQAGLCFHLMHKILLESPDCAGKWDAVVSGKRIVGINANAEYVALSADAKTGYGRDLKVILLDEAQTIVGPTSEFTDMLESRQGSHDDALFIIVSTQARSDADYLSMAIDNAIRTQEKTTVCHLYAAEKDCDLMDRKQWYVANPGLGKFRSIADLEKNMREATQIPEKEAKARNQYLNQRVAMDGLAFPPTLWKACAGEIDLEVFRQNPVIMGLDLSAKNDLTAAVMCAEDDNGDVHVLPLVFCPTSGIEERSRRDKAPYDLWVRQEKMVPIGGKTMDFDQIAEAIKEILDFHGITIAEVHYDRHSMDNFRAACTRQSTLQYLDEENWIGVVQSFKEMGVRLGSLSGIIVEGRLRHGGHPVLAMAASNAVAQSGREGISALAKHKSTQRIDPAVALVMAAWPFGEGRTAIEEWDVAAVIG